MSQIKSFETDLEALKAACSVIDCMLADVTRTFTKLEQEHFKLSSAYKALKDRAELERGGSEGQANRFLNDEELALFMQSPETGHSSDNDLVIDEVDPAHSGGEGLDEPSDRESRLNTAK